MPAPDQFTAEIGDRPVVGNAPGYRHPAPAVGDTVLWCPDRQFRPENSVPALITKVGAVTVDLTYFPNSAGVMPKYGVRHGSDPNVSSAYSDGFWRHRQVDLDTMEVVSQMRRLLSQAAQNGQDKSAPKK